MFVPPAVVLLPVSKLYRQVMLPNGTTFTNVFCLSAYTLGLNII